MAIVKVQRDKGWADGWRKYKIFINGKKKSTIKEGEEITISLEPGNYEIWGRIDYCRTSKINIDIKEDDEIYNLLIYSNLRGVKILLAWIFVITSIFRSDQWLKLKKI